MREGESQLTMPVFESNQQKMAYTQFGSGDTVFLWAHGWGHNRMAMEAIARSLPHLGTHILIDFPGFGESPLPATDWTITDYAQYLQHFLNTIKAKKIIWVGHSFGCRVGIKLAALYPDRLHQLILIAAPGLPRTRPLYQTVYYFLRVRLFKGLKMFLWKDIWKEALRQKFSSPDFNNAGPLRPIFLNAIREVLADDAKKIHCPTLLICGSEDSETPPDMSVRYKNLIPNAALLILDNFNHTSILSAASAQVSYNIKTFVQS